MLFYVHGTDHYRIKEKINELKTGFVKKRDKANLNTVNLDGEKIDLSHLIQEVMTTPFLGEKKMIVVKNIWKNKKAHAELAKFLKEKIDAFDNILVLADLLDSEKHKKFGPRGAIFTLLTKQQYCWQFNLMNNRELSDWVSTYTKKNDIKIDRDASQRLIISSGNDLNQLTSELSKLSAFANGKNITSDDLDSLINTKLDENIFDLIDALGQKNKKRAIELIDSQLKGGNHPLMLLKMFVRQFKIILQVVDGANNTKLKLHPFVFQKASGQARNFQASELLKIYQDLLKIEVKIKKGYENPQLLLDLFVANNC
jgi:DNA polymerase III subunit delta